MPDDRRVFLSYRREETRHITGRIADHIGIHRVFMDVDRIEPGADFRDAIISAVDSCAALVAVIGPNWVGARDHRGRRKLDDSDDLVTIEIARALNRGILVVPVLVDGAKLPDSDELPPVLRPVASRHAIRIDHETFTTDVGRLVIVINDVLRAVSNDFADPDDVVARMLPSDANMKRLASYLQLDRFTGRNQMRDDIDAAIDQLCSGYVIVQAEAGLGKTAFAADLVQRREPSAFHFTWLPNGRSPESARLVLAAQLIFKWGLRDNFVKANGEFPPHADTPGWLVDVLAAAAARRDQTCPGQPLVLIVDGLDEAEPAAPGADTGIPLGLPRPEHLPDGVFIIATARYGLPLLPMHRATCWREIRVDSVTNLDDMRKYLDTFVDGAAADAALMSALARHSVEPHRFAHALAARCGGVWIYMRYVLDEICSGSRAPNDIASLPNGLIGYYLNQIERWRSCITTWATHGQPLLATLVALQRPADANDLAHFSDIAGFSDDATEILNWLDRHLRAFLDVSIGNDDLPRYAIRHQSLRDIFARDRIDAGRGPDAGVRSSLSFALAAAHRRITRVLMASISDSNGRTSKGQSDPYSSAHLARHAAGGGLLDELVEDPDFLFACEPASLLRNSSQLVSTAGRAALSAYQAFAERRKYGTQSGNARQILSIWARKTGSALLAERTAPSGVHVVSALWAGTSHAVLFGFGSAGHMISAICELPMPDGTSFLATIAHDGKVRIWDPADSAYVREFSTNHLSTRAISAVPAPGQAALIATAGAGTIRLWDPETGSLLDEFSTGPASGVAAICAVPLPDDPMMLASVEYGGAVRLWDLSIRQQVAAFSTDGGGSRLW